MEAHQWVPVPELSPFFKLILIELKTWNIFSVLFIFSFFSFLFQEKHMWIVSRSDILLQVCEAWACLEMDTHQWIPAAELPTEHLGRFSQRHLLISPPNIRRYNNKKHFKSDNILILLRQNREIFPFYLPIICPVMDHSV